MKNIQIAFTGLLLITSLTITAQDGKKASTEKKMSCCMNKTTAMTADSSKCKGMKCDTTACKKKCADMKTAMKDCDKMKCDKMSKK